MAAQCKFRQLKNPYYLAIRPQFHWTDHKIKVHCFICVIAYLMMTLLSVKLQRQMDYRGSPEQLIRRLNNIRLATLLDINQQTWRTQAQYQLERLTNEERDMIASLGITNWHKNRPSISGLRVYS